MIVTEAYKNADREYLEGCTVKELSQKLTIGNIKKRSKATTKAQKIELLLSDYFGYSTDENGIITQNIPTAELEAPKMAKKARKQPTRRELDVKAQQHGWTVVMEGETVALKHDRAMYGDNMATARSVPAMARKLAKIKSEYLCAMCDGTPSAFYSKYYWKNTGVNNA